jgi:NAD(P)-dependent dehydrogenase (short-subunit alcohol dehydrogenase family)
VIAPGGVKSDMALEAGWRYIPGATPDWTMDQIEAHVNKWTPLGRIGTPQDIAKVVRFLCTEDGAWMNGTCQSFSDDQMIDNTTRSNHHYFGRCYQVDCYRNVEMNA